MDDVRFIGDSVVAYCLGPSCIAINRGL